MKYSKLMRERIRRTTILLKELGYEVEEGEFMDDSYSAGFENDSGFQGGVFIDRDSKFLEFAFTFSFAPEMGEFLRERIEDIMQVCYEFGCYSNLQAGRSEISFSIFSKIYYAGLSYFSLKETLRDFREAIEAIKTLLEIPEESEATHGDP